MFDGIGNAQLRAGFTKSSTVLCSGVDGDGEDGGGFDEFFGGENAASQLGIAV
jgi:hypothetical protein